MSFSCSADVSINWRLLPVLFRQIYLPCVPQVSRAVTIRWWSFVNYITGYFLPCAVCLALRNLIGSVFVLAVLFACNLTKSTPAASSVSTLLWGLVYRSYPRSTLQTDRTWSSFFSSIGHTAPWTHTPTPPPFLRDWLLVVGDNTLMV